MLVGDNHARFGVLRSICSIFTISFFVNLFYSKNSNLPHCFTDLIHTEYRKLHKTNGHSPFVLPPIMRSSVGQCRNTRFRQMYASHVIITSANELANQTVHKRSFFKSFPPSVYRCISNNFINIYSFFILHTNAYQIIQVTNKEKENHVINVRVSSDFRVLVSSPSLIDSRPNLTSRILQPHPPPPFWISFYRSLFAVAISGERINIPVIYY